MPKTKSKIKDQNHSSSQAVLVVDVGNTYIHFAVFEGSDIFARFGVESGLRGKTLVTKLKNILRTLPLKAALTRVMICSVVPPVTVLLQRVIKKELGLSPVVVGQDIEVPIINRYRNPKQVGQDRLVCAYAACELYGAPAIVIDLGTAITLDAVSARKEYLGGIIVPGIRITAETLFERTALLPLVDIHQPQDLIGRDTRESILSGIFYGYGEMIKGLIGLLSKKFKKRPQVILTGGHAQLMASYIREKHHVVDGDLVMKGMLFLTP